MSNIDETYSVVLNLVSCKVRSRAGAVMFNLRDHWGLKQGIREEIVSNIFFMGYDKTHTGIRPVFATIRGSRCPSR